MSSNAFIVEDFPIWSNADFDIIRVYNPNNVLVDLTGYTAELQIRINRTDTSPQLTLTSPAGGIILGGTAATVYIAITSAQAAALQASMPGGVGYYDCILTQTSTGIKTRFMSGAVNINLGITRP